MDIASIIMILVGFVALWVLALSIIVSFTSLAPWVPTRRSDFERINRLADLKDGHVFYEIGSGTARLSAFIAEKNPKACVVGIELALPLYLLTKARTYLRGPRNLSIRFGNALAQDYRDTDVVYLYGLTKTANGALKEKLERELKPGGKFISYTFTVQDWQGRSSFIDKPSAERVGISVCTR